MNPGDVIILGKKVWRLTGVYLGANGQQSVYGLESISLKKPATGKGIIPEMYVPVEIVDALNEVDTIIYKR